MPVMSAVERSFCRSAPWAAFARRVVLPWALDGHGLAGAVLEIGGGNGVMAEQVLRRQPDLLLTVVDVDPRMTADSSSRLAAYESARVKTADVTRLPFSDGSFDVVTSFLMLHHVIRWQDALDEVARVLRPGGLARSGFPDSAVKAVETHDLFAEDANWWAKTLAGIDTIIHAAWYVEPGKYLDSPLNIDCAMGSLAIAEGALCAGVRKFVGIGTCFEYRLPNAAITETSEPGPVTLYAADDTAAVLDASRYRIDAPGGRLIFSSPHPGLRAADAVSIAFTAGYGDAADVPAPIKSAIEQTVMSALQDAGVLP